MNSEKNHFADSYSPLTLAFVGDGVYDLLVREWLVKQANRPVGELNKMKVKLVKCESQAQLMKELLPSLTDRELAVFKRGRNAAPKCTPRHGTVADYHTATGMECLFGYLYLNSENERISELFNLIISNSENDTEKVE